jgi:hypothetical protein
MSLRLSLKSEGLCRHIQHGSSDFWKNLQQALDARKEASYSLISFLDNYFESGVHYETIVAKFSGGSRGILAAIRVESRFACLQTQGQSAN